MTLCLFFFCGAIPHRASAAFSVYPLSLNSISLFALCRSADQSPSPENRVAHSEVTCRDTQIATCVNFRQSPESALQRNAWSVDSVNQLRKYVYFWFRVWHFAVCAFFRHDEHNARVWAHTTIHHVLLARVESASVIVDGAFLFLSILFLSISQTITTNLLLSTNNNKYEGDKAVQSPAFTLVRIQLPSTHQRHPMFLQRPRVHHDLHHVVPTCHPLITTSTSTPIPEETIGSRVIRFVDSVSQ